MSIENEVLEELKRTAEQLKEQIGILRAALLVPYSGWPDDGYDCPLEECDCAPGEPCKYNEDDD